MITDQSDPKVKQKIENEKRTFGIDIYSESMVAEGQKIHPGNIILSHGLTKDGLGDFNRDV